MKIKRVEIIGFKSFCDRAVVQIGESITGVVGPNGCGKSNIVDAIRWCMGEQSAKHLRGKAMEDVIFAGSESRGPAPMAEVSITCDDVGFSHERLAIEKSSDEAETERAIEALPDEDAPAELLAEGSVATEVAPAAELTDAPAAAETDEVRAVFLDAEGKPMASPTEEVAEMLADQPPAFDFARYTEVTITRRLYRDGTSNYFINKTACRLRDITDFFLGTGVGTKAYAIIEQGRIGQIVSSRPADRRAIIEEAAGITKFKSKKKAAEKKLDQTRQNLMRVNDITTELDKRMGTLRRQSQKAERYRKYRAELRDIELWKASHKWLELSAEGGNVSNRLGEAREEETLSRTEWTTKDAHVLAERAELSVEERRLVVLQEQGYELENRLKLAESKQVFERREADDLEARVATGNTEIDDLNTQRERGAEELSAKRLELDELVAQVDREQADVAQRDATTSEARQMLANAQGMLDEARRGLGARRTEIATADAQLESLGRRRDEATRRMERVTGETEQVSERVHELDREGKKASGQLAELRQTRIDLGDQSENFKARNELLVDEVARTEKEVDGLQRDLNKRQSRLSSLQEIQERYEGFARGTRAVMTRMEEIAKGSAIHGIVADVVRAPEALEIAVEVALGDRLGGVLVAEATVGTAAIDFLKRHSGGRSAFVPVDDRRIAADATVTPDVVVASASDAHFGEVVDDGHDGDVTDMTDDGAEAVAVHDDAWETDPAGYDGLDAPASDDAVAAPIAVAGGETYGGEGNPSRVDLDHLTQPAPVEPVLVAAPLPPRIEPTGEGILGRMVELVEFADGYADVGKRLVDGIYVVDTLERALYWHARGVTDRLVTITGDVVDPDGTQWGGSRDKQGAGVLAQMREIRELEEMVGTLSEQLADATARLTTARQEQKQVAKAIEGLRAQQHAGDLAIMSFEKDEVRVRVELDRHRDRLNHLSNEQLELEQRLVTIAGDETAARERKRLAEDQIADLERRQLDLLAEVQDHRDRMEDLQQVLIEARVRAAQLGEKRAATESSALRIERNDAELATRTQRIRHEIEAAI
ncbi:MAG: AAA family ATPase [Proteobacteria bacterium]|nr:AAA family ATPase [Pseudomonadota bacterium]